MIYYNDNNPKVVRWLRGLMKTGQIPQGYIDDRDIQDIVPSDLEGFKQCHFFAGIGGWPLAVQLAGVEDEIWTGSCPCQPFSEAGIRNGADDPRALWWAWRWLIQNRKPAKVVGEQIAGGIGNRWLAGVRSDMELLSYSFGAADLPAASVGAPIKRQRLYWVASASGEGLERHGENVSQQERPERQQPNSQRSCSQGSCHSTPWDDASWIVCEDGYKRRIKPGIEPMAPRLSRHMDIMSGYGNSIVPELAAKFLRCVV